MKLRLLKMLALALAVLALLSGCDKGGDIQQPEPFAPLEPADYKMQATFPFIMGRPEQPFFVDEKGAYYRAYLEYDPDAQAQVTHLMYLNFETMALELADDSPIAALERPFQAGNHLYEITLQYSEDSLQASIYTITQTDLAGNNKQSIDIAKFSPSSFYQTSFYAFDGESLYFIVESRMSLQDPRNPYGRYMPETAYLVRADFKRGKWVQLAEFDAYSQFISISGVYKDGLILKIETIPKYRPEGASDYIGDYVLETDRDVAYWAFPLFSPDHEIQIYNSAIHGPYESRYLELSYIDYYDYKSYYFDRVLDTAELERFDLLSGSTERQEWTLAANRDDRTAFPRVVAITPTHFIVEREFFSFEDGHKGFATCRYALIEKEDYFNSNPNYLEFDYSVLEELTSELTPMEPFS